MGIEAGEVIVAIDDVPADEAIVISDPVDATLIAPIDPIPLEDGTSDMGLGDVILIGDSILFTTAVIDDAVIDDTFVDGSPVDGAPVDDSGEPPVDDGASGGEPDMFITVGISGDTSEDGTVYTIDGNGEIIDRPVDPMPNWRTLVGEAGDGETAGGDTGGGDGTGGEGGSDDTVIVIDDGGILYGDSGIVYDDSGIVYDGTDIFYSYTTMVFDKDTTAEEGEEAAADDGSAGPDDVIYTLDPSDPLIYATSAGGATPGRPADPQPNWRGNSAPVADPAPADTGSDVVRYAAAEPFHTGLDLL